MATAVTSSAATASFTPEIRVQHSVLTRMERRTLLWIAPRLPAAIHSDHLTLLALLAMIGVGASYWLSGINPLGLVLASVLLAVNWFGDSLDGTLARVRNRQRPRYGYYVDHVVDVVGIVFLFSGLALGGLMHPAVAAITLLAYFLLSLEVYLATHSLGEFHMSFFGFGPTELRLLLAMGNTALFFSPTPNVANLGLTPFDIGGIIGTAGLVAIFVSNAVRNTRRLYREETVR